MVWIDAAALFQYSQASYLASFPLKNIDNQIKLQKRELQHHFRQFRELQTGLTQSAGPRYVTQETQETWDDARQTGNIPRRVSTLYICE